MLYNVNKLLMLDIRKVLDILFIRNFQTGGQEKRLLSIFETSSEFPLTYGVDLQFISYLIYQVGQKVHLGFP